jgi:uncharacterized membrane protein
LQEWLVVITKHVVLVVDAMAVLMIAIGTVQAFLLGLRAMLAPTATDHERHEVWLRFARWLIAALTFQLAADVLETTVAPTWEGIGQLAAIAAIRTFLSFFLERDLLDIQRRNGGSEEGLTCTKSRSK